MTINHPAHGPVSLDRLHQISEILSKAAAQSDGGNLGYAMADAVKVIDGAIAAFNAELYVPTVQCWSCREVIEVSAVGDCDGYCPKCDSPIDLDEEPYDAAILQAGNSPVTPDDVLRMDWLVSKTVDVREPMVYGSHSIFWSQTITDEDDDYHATKLREQIDAAMAAEQHRSRRMYNVNNLMIDLESMGKKPNAPIVSIGAVFFDPQSGDLGQEFYTAVNLESAMEQGAVPDGDTILWWLRQSSEARSAICVDDAMPISSALSELSHFINRHSDNPKYLKVWGNGATFDNVILRGAYERAGQVCPWQFWNDHDVRTIVTLGGVVGFDPKRDMPFDGVAHNALADARHQAKYVSAIWQKLIPTTSNN